MIVPVEVMPTFEFKDGQYVELAYELLRDKPSGCTLGVSAKIYKIAEIVVPTMCRIPITFVKTNTTQVSYQFKTDLQPVDSKFYWYFGDGGSSTLADPSYVFKKAGSWAINLKVVDKAGKVCYGETKGTFEGETNPTLTGRGKVKKLTATGCDLVIALDNVLLIPVKMTTEFQLKEGQYVEFTYEKFVEKVSACKEGTDVKIITIKEIPVINSCKFEIAVKPKEATPNTYFFSTVSNAEVKTWSWKFGDGKTSDQKNPEHAYEKTGTYEVSCTITTAAGCTETRVIKHTVLATPLANCSGAISILLFDPTDKQCNGKATVVVLKSVTGTDIINKSELGIYPNPVKDMLKINFGNPVEGTMNIEIMNIAGKRAYAQQIKSEGYNHVNINVQHLKSGIYFLRVTNGKYLITDRKFIKAD